MASSLARNRVNFSGGELLADLIFGVIGMAAFAYGKKQGQWKTAVLAVALMCYPYFITGTIWLWGIGVVLTLALFVWHD
jgi:hypothetical protein